MQRYLYFLLFISSSIFAQDTVKTDIKMIVNPQAEVFLLSAQQTLFKESLKTGQFILGGNKFLRKLFC